ncbi:hypothetical protein [Nocardia donostiensis]|uniref:hypothetical protein n=1 Tax=Nocardia donostiensis TaxID=1538463 RepID=UPI001FE9FF10|nr:hypothetical protein [Nocardia donostiensis]
MPNRLPVRPRAGCISGSPFDWQHGGPRDVNRRTALRLAGGGVAGALALGAMTGCADDSVAEPDPLAAQEVAARADAAAAQAAIAVYPQHHDALRTIAAERAAHAEALRTEIDRVIGVYGDGTTPVRRTPPITTTPAPAEPPTIEAVRTQLAASQRSAATLAASQSDYRAGLLASISAACAVHAGVLLA